MLSKEYRCSEIFTPSTFVFLSSIYPSVRSLGALARILGHEEWQQVPREELVECLW